MNQCRAKPTNYKLSIHDIEFGGNFTYQGTVAIDVNIKNDESWSDLVLNAHQLKIHSAELKTDTTSEAKDISYDEKRQRVTLDFGTKFQYKGDAVITVKFEGTINNVRIPDTPLFENAADGTLDHGRLLPLQVQAQGRGPRLLGKGR